MVFLKKMTIKEAGRYANSLSKLQTSLSRIVSNGINSKLYKEVETHKKSEAYSEHADEVIEREYEDVVDVELKDILVLLNDVIKEKINLACEIQEAKKLINIEVDGLALDIDTALEYAKILREISDTVYSPLKNKKDNKRKARGLGYAFNVDGNQSSYSYEIEIVTSVLFNVKEMGVKDKEIRFLADNLSQEIDKEMSKELVNHSPKFNYLDDVSDIVANFVSAK